MKSQVSTTEIRQRGKASQEEEARPRTHGLGFDLHTESGTQQGILLQGTL